MREKLIELLQHSPSDIMGNHGIGALADRLIANDVVPVVRCKDCKHWHEETGFCEEHSRFDSFGMDWNMFAEDDFCSYGERKDNGK